MYTVYLRIDLSKTPDGLLARQVSWHDDCRLYVVVERLVLFVSVAV